MKTHTCQAFRIKTDSPTWNKEFGEPAVRLGLVGLWTDSVFWGWPSKSSRPSRLSCFLDLQIDLE